MNYSPKSHGLALTVALLALVDLSSATHAQSADQLISKLAEKGILTAQEAEELRRETDPDFTKAYQAKSGLSDWVTSLKVNGELRLRYEGFYGENPAFTDRHRFRYRLRLGTTVAMKNNLEVGLRLTSGVPGGDPLGNNDTLQDNGSKKPIAVDLAYAKWTPVQSTNWAAAFTFGKLNSPFAFSDLVLDADYTPEGMTEEFRWQANAHHAFKLTFGEFVLDELESSSHDPYWLVAQARWNAEWHKRFSSSLGFTAMTITDEEMLTSSAVPNINVGNTRVNTGTAVQPVFSLANEYRPIVVDAAVTCSLDHFPGYQGAFPIKFCGDYLYNSGASRDNCGYTVGIVFGKAGKKGLWEILYRYRVIEADAWYEELTDSDSGAFYETAPVGGKMGYGGGTNVRGHIIGASYSPADSLTFCLTYFLTELIHENPPGSRSGMGRLQASGVWKF